MPVCRLWRAVTAVLRKRVPQLKFRPEFRFGHPWLVVWLDFIEANVVHDTLRLDFDGRSIRGGWSPSYLNWDDGVPAKAT